MEEDLKEIKDEILKLYSENNLAAEVENEEEINQDFEEMIDILTSFRQTEHCSYPNDFIEIMEKYDPDWWEHCTYGERIDNRIYLWIVGFQEGLKQLSK